MVVAVYAFLPCSTVVDALLLVVAAQLLLVLEHFVLIGTLVTTDNLEEILQIETGLKGQMVWMEGSLELDVAGFQSIERVGALLVAELVRVMCAERLAIEVAAAVAADGSEPCSAEPIPG